MKVAYPRKRYWNEPTLTLWERAYLPEIVRGLAITSGVFLRNMGRWMTGKKGALTTYYPEETRADYSPINRGKHVLTQLVVFLVKVLLVCSFQILVRWSLPRFRFDQLLAFAWKFMLPIALVNLTITAVLLWSHQPRPM